MNKIRVRNKSKKVILSIYLILTFTVPLHASSWNHLKKIDLPNGTVPAFECFGKDAGGITKFTKNSTEGVLFAAEVPFWVNINSPQAMVTGLEECGSIYIKINSSAYEIFLLASSRISNRTKNPFSGYSLDSHFFIQINYENGQYEKVIPQLFPSQEYRAADWQHEADKDQAALIIEEDSSKKRVFVYAVKPALAEKISSIEIVDKKPVFDFALFAITLDSRPGINREPCQITTLPIKKIKYKSCSPLITKTASFLQGESSMMMFKMDISHGLTIQNIVLKTVDGDEKIIRDSSSPLFLLKVEDKLLVPDDFQFTNIQIKSIKNQKSCCRITAKPKDKTIPILLELNLTLTNPAKLTMSLKIKAQKICTVQPTFPVLQNIRFGENVDDDEYYYPIKGGVLHSRPVKLNNIYGGWGAQVQFMDIFDEQIGGGLSLRVEDTSLVSKRFELRKMQNDHPFEYNRFKGNTNYWLPLDDNSNDSAMAVHYQPWILDTNEQLELPLAVLELHQGNWKQALVLYRDWVDTWYPSKPVNWMRRVFAHRAFHPQDYIKENRYVDFNDIYYGFEDAAEIGFWWQGMWLRGDYEYIPERNDPQSLRAFVEEIHAKGLKVTNYIEGYWQSEDSKLGKEHGKEWGIIHKDGTYSDDFSKYNWCQSIEPYQDYITGVVARIVRDLNLDGHYMDCSARVVRDCYHPEHNHKTPGVFLKGAAQMFQKIRGEASKYNPDVLLASEECGGDVFSQYLDWAFSYSLFYRLGEMPEELAPQGIDFFHFIFPEVGIIQLLGEDNERGCRLAFFNGTGFNNLFRDKSLHEYWKKYDRVFHKYQNSFVSEKIEPLVPTLRKNLYANAFYGEKQTVYTLFNANYRTIRGSLIAFPYRKNTHYINPFTEQNYSFKKSNDQIVVSGEIDPRDVTAIVIKIKE